MIAGQGEAPAFAWLPAAGLSLPYLRLYIAGGSKIIPALSSGKFHVDGSPEVALRLDVSLSAPPVSYCQVVKCPQKLAGSRCRWAQQHPAQTPDFLLLSPVLVLQM